MKQLVKRILSLLLIAALLIPVLPAGALAQTQLPGRIKTAQTQIHSNPLYEGLVEPGTLVPPQPQLPQAGTAAQGNETYVDEAGAVEQLRQAMVDRQESCVLYICTDRSDHNALMEDLFFGAIAHTGNPVEGDYIAWQYGSWRAGSSYYQQDSTYYYTSTFTLTYYTDASQEAVMDTQVEKLLRELSLEEGTQYEKIRGIYDYVCANITYDYDNLNDRTYLLKHTAYAGLINGTCVCQGYAILVYRLALELGLDCRLIAGYGAGEAHGWNIVELEGLYYNLDSTWDAGESEYSYFLVSEANFPRHVRGNMNGTDYAGADFYARYPMSEENYSPEPTATGTCGEDLTWVLRGSVLTVTGTGTMTDYAAGEQPWNAYLEDIRTVRIGDGALSLGSNAFSGCENLAQVLLPAGLKTLGSGCFLGCGALTELSWPQSLKTIGASALSRTGLTEAVLPQGVISIGEEAFLDCSLTRVEIPGSVTRIGPGAFRDNGTLLSISVAEDNADYCLDEQGALYTADMKRLLLVPGAAAGRFRIPESVTALEAMAFRGTTGPERLLIPASVTQLGAECFSGCTLQQLIFRGDAPAIAEDAFCGTSAELWYREDNATWTDPVQSNYGGTLSWTAVKEYALLEDSVTELPDRSTSAVIRSEAALSGFLGAWMDGAEVARDCYTLSEGSTVVTFHADYLDSLAMGEHVFLLEFTDGYTTGILKILSDHVHDYSYRTQVTEPTCTEGGYTTCTCTCGDSIRTDLTDPLGHTYVDGSCTRCGGTDPDAMDPGETEYSGSCGEHVYWRFDAASGTLTIFGSGAMADYAGQSGLPWRNYLQQIRTLTVESGVTTVGNAACTGMQQLRSVRLCEGITSIGSCAFAMTGALQQIVLPQSLQYIGEQAFDSSGLTAVTVPAGVKSIGQMAFFFCTGLTCVTFEGDVPELPGGGIFMGVSARGRYPADNATWTQEARSAFGGSITWEAVSAPVPVPQGLTRIYGQDRIATSLAIADQLKSVLNVSGFDSIIVASALNFPDALTGSYLAAVKRAPILLTYDAAQEQILTYISRNLAPGGTVYLLGGASAVSEDFAQALQARGITGRRLAGSDRFGTNLEILKEAGVSSTQPVLICTATGFADSLSASAAGLPIVLVHGSLRQDQKEFLASTSGSFLIIGGEAAVSASLEGELKALGMTERLSGAGRYETSVLVARRFCPEPQAAVLAYARNYPDGLCGGPLAYVLGAPLILTDDFAPAAADEYVQDIPSGIVVGGSNLISDRTARDIFDLAA